MSRGCCQRGEICGILTFGQSVSQNKVTTTVGGDIVDYPAVNGGA